MRSVSVVFLALFAGIVPALVSPSNALSQSGVPVSEDLTRRADIVVVGKVADVRSEWNSDRSRIYTRAVVSVDQVIKGDNTQNVVTISTPGGEIGDVGEMYSHMARFKKDEQVVVFAERDWQGQLRVAGGERGKINITRNERTGKQMVTDSESLEMYTSRLKSVVKAQSQK